MIVIKAPWLPKGIRGFGGIAPFAFIRPEYVRDPTVVEHERVHNEQCKRGWWIGFWWMYLTSKRARYRYELEGYKASLRCGRPLDQCVRDLWNCYAYKLARSGYTPRTVERDLQS